MSKESESKLELIPTEYEHSNDSAKTSVGPNGYFQYYKYYGENGGYVIQKVIKTTMVSIFDKSTKREIQQNTPIYYYPGEADYYGNNHSYQYYELFNGTTQKIRNDPDGFTTTSISYASLYGLLNPEYKQKINDLLTKIHGINEIKATYPGKITIRNLDNVEFSEFAGGVPGYDSILDDIIRTMNQQLHIQACIKMIGFSWFIKKEDIKLRSKNSYVYKTHQFKVNKKSPAGDLPYYSNNIPDLNEEIADTHELIMYYNSEKNIDEMGIPWPYIIERINGNVTRVEPEPDPDQDPDLDALASNMCKEISPYVGTCNDCGKLAFNTSNKRKHQESPNARITRSRSSR